MTIRMRMEATKMSRRWRRLDLERAGVFCLIVRKMRMFKIIRNVKGIKLSRTETMVEIWRKRKIKKSHLFG